MILKLKRDTRERGDAPRVRWLVIVRPSLPEREILLLSSSSEFSESLPGTCVSSTPTLHFSSMYSPLTHLWYLSKSFVQSLPSTALRILSPPGWKLTYGVRLYTLPRSTVQQSSAVLCVATSSAEILRFLDAPRRPARSGSRFVRRIQSIWLYPAPSCTFLGAPSPPLCVPAEAGALSLFRRFTPPDPSAEVNVAFARRPPNDLPPSSDMPTRAPQWFDLDSKRASTRARRVLLLKVPRTNKQQTDERGARVRRAEEGVTTRLCLKRRVSDDCGVTRWSTCR